jgi:acyl carrier protein
VSGTSVESRVAALVEARILDGDDGNVSGSTRLVDDLQLDSLDVLLAIMIAEDVTGAAVPAAFDPKVATIGDLCSLRAPVPEGARW